MHLTSVLSSIFLVISFASLGRAQYVLDPTLKSLTLEAHNTLRASVYVPVNLTWSDRLAQEAYRRSLDQIRICALSHDGVGNFGENLAMATSNSINVPITQRLLNLWISEGYKLGEYSHWTQMVWSGSKEMGCAVVLGPSNCQFAFLTCQYYPPGNVIGRTPWTDSGIPPNFAPINVPVPTTLPHRGPSTLTPTIANPSMTFLPVELPFTPISKKPTTVSVSTITTVTPTVFITSTLGIVQTKTSYLTVTVTSAITQTQTQTVTSTMIPQYPAPELIPWPQMPSPVVPMFQLWPRPLPTDRVSVALYIYLVDFLRTFPQKAINAIQSNPKEVINSVANALIGISASSASYVLNIYSFIVATLVALYAVVL